MDVPHVKREDYQLTDISDDGYLSLMSDNGDLREDLKVPEGEVGAQLRTEYDAGKDILCTVLKSCGEEVRKHTLFIESVLIECCFISGRDRSKDKYCLGQIMARKNGEGHTNKYT